jgi:hypothetical protein
VAGYTKADYDAQYSIGAEGEWGRPGGTTEIRVHYQRAAAEGFLHPRWDALVPHLGLTASDILVVAGCGFGWSVDYIETLLPGINVVGVDISDYVNAEKDTSDEAEIDEYIIAAGETPDSERGARVKAKFHTPGPKATVVVLQEDMKNNQSRNRVRQALGNVTPTHIITEDMVQEFTDVEIAEWVTELNKLTTTEKIHIISGEGIRTAENINTITGHRTLLVGGGQVEKDLP